MRQFSVCNNVFAIDYKRNNLFTLFLPPLLMSDRPRSSRHNIENPLSVTQIFNLHIVSRIMGDVYKANDRASLLGIRRTYLYTT